MTRWKTESAVIAGSQGIALKAEKSSSWYINIFTDTNTNIILLTKIIQLNYQWRVHDMSQFYYIS